MTLKEFFQKARRRRWTVEWIGGKVTCRSGFCPLGAVAKIRRADGTFEYRPHWETAARILGLRGNDADRIVRGADYPRSRERDWLLKNLGVRP